MDSARVERLAAAVATMPDGPSRDRFVDLLEELTEQEEQTGAADTGEVDFTGVLDRAAGEDGDGDELAGDPGDPIRNGMSEAAHGHAFAPPLSAATPDVTEVVDATYVPQPPEQLPPTAPEAPAAETTKKRRWGRKS